MRRYLLASGFLVLSFPSFGQAGARRAGFERWKSEYIQDFIKDSRSPLHAGDTGNVRFFAFNPKEVRETVFIRSSTADTVTMATHDGSSKRFVVYGRVEWALPETRRAQLTLYRSLRTGADSSFLFLPFYDATNGTSTYGGGRYMDIKIADISGDRLTIDFNRAYNPWCAFKEGYSCPVPPAENRLKASIKAGERLPANYDNEQ